MYVGSVVNYLFLNYGVSFDITKVVIQMINLFPRVLLSR